VFKEAVSGPTPLHCVTYAQGILSSTNLIALAQIMAWFTVASEKATG